MRDGKSETGWLKSECGSRKAGEEFEPYIKKRVVAERVDIDVRTVTRYMSRGVLRHYKLGRRVRFKWSEVEADLREHFQVCFATQRPNPETRYPRRAE